MGLIAKDVGGYEVELIPEDTYVGVCFSIVDLGTHKNNISGKPQRQILISFELPEHVRYYEIDGEMTESPSVQSNFYTLSLNEKANLRKDLEAWRGKAFSQEQLNGFELTVLLGKSCQLSIIHTTKQDGSVRSKINAIMKLPKSVTPPTETFNPIVFFSFDDMDPEAEPQLPDVPEWVQNIILKSDEWISATRASRLTAGAENHSADPWD